MALFRQEHDNYIFCNLFQLFAVDTVGFTNTC